MLQAAQSTATQHSQSAVKGLAISMRTLYQNFLVQNIDQAISLACRSRKTESPTTQVYAIKI